MLPLVVMMSDYLVEDIVKCDECGSGTLHATKHEERLFAMTVDWF